MSYTRFKTSIGYITAFYNRIINGIILGNVLLKTYTDYTMVVLTQIIFLYIATVDTGCTVKIY